MNTIIQIFVLSILISGVFGGFNNTCKDTKSDCRKDDNSCLDPAYYFQCAKTCGCNPKTTCLDPKPDCLHVSTICVDEKERRSCPRFCGVCEGCDNLVHNDICQRKLHRCNEYNVRYLCAQTCGRCAKSCRNKLASDNVCDRFNQIRYCFSTFKNSAIMRDVCHASCTSGCRITHIP